MSRCERCNYTMPENYNEDVCKNCKKYITDIIESEYNRYKKILYLLKHELSIVIDGCAIKTDYEKGNKAGIELVQWKINELEKDIK